MKLVTVLISSLLLLSACNTVSGAGKDIKAGGAAIDDTAQDTKQKMKEQ